MPTEVFTWAEQVDDAAVAVAGEWPAPVEHRHCFHTWPKAAVKWVKALENENF